MGVRATLERSLNSKVTITTYGVRRQLLRHDRMELVVNFSITTGWFPVVVITVAIASLLLSVGWRNGSWKAQVVAGLPAAFVITVLVALAIHFFQFVPEDFPRTFCIWCWLVIFSLVVTILGWPKSHWALRLVSVIAIPPTKSKFQASEADVYIPPAWLHNPEPELPVIELIAGYPGQLSDWTRAAYADTTATDFAAKHGGTAPLIVMPDANGAAQDTEWVNSKLGNAETYLTQDVPAYIRTEFNAATGAHSVAVGGLSAGGTCATVLALRNPKVFPIFATYSGYNVETFESGNKQNTIATLFNGSTAEYNAHNPTILLTGNNFPGTSAWFEAGLQDPVPLSAADRLHTLADKIGLAQACLLTPNGGHDFQF